MKKPEALKHEIFGKLSTLADLLGVKAYVVGGFVRDFFLGLPNDDIDVVVEGSGIDFARHFGEEIGSKVSYYENYGTAMVCYGGLEVEFVGARKEMYERGSRKPIVEDGTLEDDLKRRDFTMNAMAFSLNRETFGELVDPFDGMSDIEKGIIRTPLDPDVTFSEDPLRMFRAVRFACKLHGFKIHHTAITSIMKSQHRCSILSRERITEEIDKMLSYPKPSIGLELLNDLGLWFFTERYHRRRVETIDVVKDKRLRWFMLCYRFSQSDYSADMRVLKLPQDYAKYMNRIVYTFRRLMTMPLPDNQLIRECLDVTKEDTKDAIDLSYAFLLSDNVKNYDKEDLNVWHDVLYDIFQENEEKYAHFKVCLDGCQVMKLSGLSEGTELGKLIKEIRGKILRGELDNTVASVTGYIQCWKLNVKYKENEKLD